MTPKEKKMTALAKLFKELPQVTQEAILNYDWQNTSLGGNHKPNSEIVYIPLSVIDMKKTELHWSLWLNPPRSISDKYRDYLEAIIIQPVSSQGYRIERSFLV